jgi:hypothetical protein
MIPRSGAAVAWWGRCTRKEQELVWMWKWELKVCLELVRYPVPCAAVVYTFVYMPEAQIGGRAGDRDWGVLLAHRVDMTSWERVDSPGVCLERRDPGPSSGNFSTGDQAEEELFKEGKGPKSEGRRSQESMEVERRKKFQQGTAHCVSAA